jgi:outer membrane autotransporter protein
VLNPQNFIDADKPLDAAFLAVIEDCELAGDALDHLSPESYAGLVDYGMNVTRNYTRTAMGVPGPGMAAPVQAAPVTDAKGGMAKGAIVPQAPVARNTTVFGAYSHYDSNSSSSNNSADYDIQSNGGLVGARHTMDRFTFGGFLAVDSGEITSSFLDADAEGVVGGLFVSYLAQEQNNIIVSGGVTYGAYEYDGSRDTIGGVADFEDVDNDVLDIFASVQGDVYKTDKLRLSPMLGVHYLKSEVDSITETGVGTALAVDGMDEEALLAEISLNLEYKATSNVTLLGNVGYTHNFMDADRTVGASFMGGGTPFSVRAPGLGEDLFSFGAGVVWNVSDSWSVGASYRGEFSSDSDLSNSVGVGASYSF